MRARPILILFFIAFISFPMGAGATRVTLTDVPAYDWYHGCGPTAAAAVLGYYDLNGYDNLFNASGWDAVRQTSSVADEIASPGHIDFTLSGGPEPSQDTSIAEFFGTSEDGLAHGWSYFHKAVDAFEGYSAYRGYDDWTAQNYVYGTSFVWNDLIAEIDAGRPMMFLVDSDGNNSEDHFITVLGYDNTDTGNPLYGFYNTWTEDETINWTRFRGIDDESWGVYGATLVTPAVPVPSSILLLGFGLISLTGLARKK